MESDAAVARILRNTSVGYCAAGVAHGTYVLFFHLRSEDASASEPGAFIEATFFPEFMPFDDGNNSTDVVVFDRDEENIRQFIEDFSVTLAPESIEHVVKARLFDQPATGAERSQPFSHGRVTSAEALSRALHAIDDRAAVTPDTQGRSASIEREFNDFVSKVKRGDFRDFDRLCEVLSSVGYGVALVPSAGGGVVVDRFDPWAEFTTR
jgi:hypothetical protein